jgi:intergrase/recombinase
LNWLRIKEQFEEWLQSEDYSEYFRKDVLSYLRRYVKEIKEPFDIISIMSKVNRGKRHLVLALRTLFNFYEAVGVDKEYLDSLRKPLPKLQSGIDLKIPSELQIAESLRKLPKAPSKYQALYNLLLDSGLRLVEAVELINKFKEAEQVNGFYRCELAMFRSEKQAYHGHFTELTLQLIKQVKDKLVPMAASRYYRKMGYVLPKYLRKYAFDKMIELDVPESVADFIEGRVPKRIGAKHYLALARQSSKFYPRYAGYLTDLRQKALN